MPPNRDRSGDPAPRAGGVGYDRGFAGSVGVIWRLGIPRKRRPRRTIFGGGVNAQQTAAASENRLKRTERRALSGSGCHGEGKSAFENPILPGPLRAPSSGADHAVPPRASARRYLHRRVRGGHRGRPAAVRQRRVRRLPRMRHPLPTACCACAAATAATTSWSPSAASGAAFAPREAPGAWRRRRRTWSTTSSPCASAPVGAVAADSPAPAAGRTAQAGNAGAAGGACTILGAGTIGVGPGSPFFLVGPAKPVTRCF